MFILLFYVLPFLLGIALRVLLNRLKKPYLVTAVLGIAVLIAWCIALFNATEAGIIYGMLANSACFCFLHLYSFSKSDSFVLFLLRVLFKNYLFQNKCYSVFFLLIHCYVF